MKPIKSSFPKIRRFHSRLILQWMISYISVLILPLLICTVYYAHSYSVIKKETRENQYLFLENIKEQLDSNIHELFRISTTLQINQYVSSLSYKNDTDQTYHLKQSNLQDDLSLLIVASDLIDDIYICFFGTDYVLSSSNAYRRNLSDYMPEYYIPDRTWENLHNNLELNECALWISDNKQNLLFVKPLITDSKTKKPLSIIAIQINKKKLLSLLQNQLLPGQFSALTILCQDNAQISTDAFLTSQFGTANISENNDKQRGSNSNITLVSQKNRKDDYILDMVPLNITDTILVSLTEKSIYNTVIYQMLTVLFATLLISIVLGIIVTYLYSWSNYRPIKEIMGYIKDIPTLTDEKNEYSKIKKMITTTNSELLKQKILMKNNYLYKILLGELPLSQVSASISEQFHLDFKWDISIIVIIRYTATNTANDVNVNANDQLANFITQNILSELLYPEFPDFHFCFNHLDTIAIINVPFTYTNADNRIINILKTFYDYNKTNFNLLYHIGISNLHSNDHLSDAFTQANNALEYIHLFSSDSICKYNDTPSASQIGYLELKNTDYIINLVLSANIQKLEEYFQDINCELDTKRLSTDDAKSFLYFFYNVSMRLKVRLQHQYTYNIIENFFIIYGNFFHLSLHEAFNITEHLYLQIALYVKEQKDKITNNRVNSVLQYIDGNYFDLNLNLNSIAQHFNVTPSYLSKKFKEENDISVNEYLYKVRIIHSLKLIADTSLKITDISQMVGFQDSNAFIRIFKLYQGCTPGKYKNSHLEIQGDD